MLGNLMDFVSYLHHFRSIQFYTSIYIYLHLFTLLNFRLIRLQSIACLQDLQDLTSIARTFFLF